ncbi:HMHA1 protein, partial [Probosciger aterrimus]|nr:HMHA1 protein [Probosciger aterrimus]
GTLKRPTSLSRHASAAGFPLTPAGPRAVPKGHKTPTSSYSPMEGGEGPFIDTEDISQLLTHVARFADALEKLRDVVLRDDPKEPQRPLAHECLGETLRVLRQVINKYPLLNTLETLTAAGTLISKVKGFHYESNNEADKREFEKAVETIAVSFSSTVSEFLMGEVDSSTILSIQNQTMENLYGGIPGPGGDGLPSVMESYATGEAVGQGLGCWAASKPSARRYSPCIPKPFPKEALKDASVPGAGLRVVPFLLAQANMPFLSIYLLTLEQDTEHATSVLQAATTLQQQTFLQPLSTRRLEHEKRRKEIKEQWHRAQRKLQEAEANLRKAKQTYMQRSEEHDKAKYMAVKAEEDQQSTSSSITTKTLDKKRRLEEEAKNKVGMDTDTGCASAWQEPPCPSHRAEWHRNAHRGPTAESCSPEMLFLLVLPIHDLCPPLPLAGGRGDGHVSDLRCGCQRAEAGAGGHQDIPFSPSFHPRSPFTRTRKGSFNAEFSSGAGSDGAALPKDGAVSEGGAGAKEQHGGTTAAEGRGGRGHQVHKSWPTSVAEADSSLDSSTGVGAGGALRSLPIQTRLGFCSSSAHAASSGAFPFVLLVGINGITPEMTAPTGPFRNIGLSKAAQTHRLRKLRTPSKCRECNSYVYFQGAECEECYLACHKKCLESLAIQCGHKKLQGKLQLFGQDFTKASESSADGIPFIIKKCITEIEKRALKTKGIYRVNGVKTRVEKLCQAFENGKELVELSQASPHDISNVLKLYLRQLPEPIMPFRMYNELMGLAKESLQGGEAKGRSGKGGPELEDKGADTDKVVVNLVLKLKELLKDLPRENMATLQCLLQHLRRIVEVEQDNKMTSSNLGIVFGPTLMRPRPTDATISLSSLVDYPHQSRIIEALIIFYPTIFE